MPNNWFDFKQFRILQEDSAFKVGTDGVLLGAWSNVEGSEKILDIGCGTGLITIMTAQRSAANIVGVELDHLSALEAAVNIAASPWSERIELIESDIVKYTASTKERFDHIITNPPYFTNSLTNPDPRLSTARHTSELSSAALLESVAKLLTANGRFSLILPYTEANVLIADAVGYELYCSRMLNIKPLPDKAVKRILLEFTRKRKTATTGFIIIEAGKRHEYTREYRELTKDFYLHF